MVDADPAGGDRASLIGQRIGGKYEVVSFLARGATGGVYLADQLSLGRRIVLKVLQPNAAVLAGDPNFAERFRREAATCGRLHHPNTVTMLDFGEHPFGDSTLYYMAMEHVPGRTLRKVLTEVRRFEPARAVAIAIDILKSLREAHALGIVHRDLKPGNVMIVASDEGERVKVLDFGVAKGFSDAATDDQALTQTGTLLGTPHYMSPEQIQSGPVDGRTDLYALGCILFEMLSGSAPFRGNSAIDTCARHLTWPIPTLDEAAGEPLGAPPALEAIVRRCLAKTPVERFASADELLHALRQLHLAPGSTASGAPLRIDRPRAVWAAAALLVVGVPGVLLGLIGLGVVLAVALDPGDAPVGAAPQPEVVVIGGGGEDGEGDAAVAPAEPDGPTVPEDVAVAPEAVELRSEPAGAEVWRGDLLLGATPLAIPLPVDAEPSLVLRRPGYQDAAVSAVALGESAGEPVVIRLVPRPARKAQPAAPAPEPFTPVLRTER